jgi:hypothetical protein
MHVLTVCYGHPSDPEAFDAYYTLHARRPQALHSAASWPITRPASTMSPDQPQAPQ